MSESAFFFKKDKGKTSWNFALVGFHQIEASCVLRTLCPQRKPQFSAVGLSNQRNVLWTKKEENKYVGCMLIGTTAVNICALKFLFWTSPQMPGPWPDPDPALDPIEPQNGVFLEQRPELLPGLCAPILGARLFSERDFPGNDPSIFKSNNCSNTPKHSKHIFPRSFQGLHLLSYMSRPSLPARYT